MSVELANRIAFAERRLSVRATDLVYERTAGLDERYGPAGRFRCEEDTAMHLRVLASAVATGDRRILVDYFRWLAPLLERYGVPQADLDASLRAIVAAIGELVPEAATPAAELLAGAAVGG